MFHQLAIVCGFILTSQALGVPLVTGPDSPEEEDVNQSAIVAPELVYRMAFLEQRKNSAYHNDEEHRDWADQLYLSLIFKRSFDYSHDVVIEPAVRTVREKPSKVELVIDQAYVVTRFNQKWGLVAGKKVEYEGSGFIVNPSDLIHENKEIFDVLYQRSGKFITKVTGNFSRGSIAVGVLPQKSRDFGEGRLLLQGSTDLFDVDTRLAFTQQREEKGTFGLSLSRFFGGDIELHFDGRYQSRQRTLKEDNKDLREVAFNEIESTEGAGVYLAGTRLIISPKRTLILEGIINEPGLSRDQAERFFESERFTDAAQTIPRRGEDVLTPDSRLMGRTYGFLSIRDDETFQSTGLSASALVNTDDKSVFATLQWRRTFSEVTSVDFTPTFYRGPVASEFGELPFATSLYLSFKGLF